MIQTALAPRSLGYGVGWGELAGEVVEKEEENKGNEEEKRLRKHSAES